MSGWAPAYGEDRRKDYSRAAYRARVLRKNETPHEKRLWKLLRELNREGANFRRQTNVGQRVFDFADLRRKILIELDGAVHELPEVQAADKKKEIDAVLRGYRVLRFTNEELAADPAAIIKQLLPLITRPSSQREEGREEGRAIKRSLPPPPPQGEGES
ncbi:MAG: endonuclease domain-containing protein [Hyphomonadaceae bacterium]